MTKSNEPARTPASNPTGAVTKSKRRILVVDDEQDHADMIAVNLQRAGYDAVTAYNGEDALELVRKQPPDLIVLDIMMPGLDGTEVTRRLRADPKNAGIAIIMLTAKSEETDEIVGLRVGADDYVTKPFSVKVLQARVETLLRRKQATPQTDTGILRAGPLEMDTTKHEVTVNGTAVKLTLTEFKLLAALVTARERVLSRVQLMDKAMGSDVFVTDRAIDVHITSIRKKLGEAAWLVHTVRGVGYRLRESESETE